MLGKPELRGLCTPVHASSNQYTFALALLPSAGEAEYDALDKIDRLEVFEEYIR